MTDPLLGRHGRPVLIALGLAVAAFVAAPILVLVPVSVSGDSTLILPPRSYSLAAYEKLIDQPRWRRSAGLSLGVALLAAGLATVLGTLAAIGISRVGPGLARALRLVFIAPMIVPLMVMAVGFFIFFAEVGLLGRFASLPLSHAVLGVPFVVLPVLARLVAMEPQLERAAASLGAGEARTLLRVVLPQLGPAMLAGFVLAFIISFDEVIVAQFLTGPRLETLPRRMWEGLAQGGLDSAITAIGTLQLALAVLVTLAFERWRRRQLRLGAAVEAAMVAPAPSLPAPVFAAPEAARAPSGSPGGRRDGPGGVPIRFERLTRRFGAHVALDALSLDVGAGEFLTVLGPSGSGKSTMLMIVAGFLAADEGRLLIGGRDVSRLPPHRRDIGVVFQNYALFPHLDVRENLAFPLRARGLPRAEIARRVERALALVRLERFADRRIQALSGGQQQRVAFARAVIFEPSALLMDEPLAALDRSLRLEMQAELRALQRMVGHTTIYVTHDQEEALNLSDRIAVLDGGRLQQVGTPKDLYFRPANPFVAGFFGEANLIAGRVAGGVFLPDGTDLRLPAPAGAEGPAVACLRPEALRLVAEGGQLAGRLTDVRFAGGIERLRVETAAGTLTLTRQTCRAAPPPPAGSPVEVAFDATALHLMEAPE